MTALLALAALVTIGTPCTNQRALPSLSASITACLAPGTSVNLTGQIVHADGHDWQQTDDGNWIASDYLGSPGQASVMTPPLNPPQNSVVNDQASADRIAPAAPSETPAQVRSDIDQAATTAGLNAACVEAIAQRESGDNLSAVNPSGARGLFGWLPQGGEWSSTPLGRAGLAVADASASQQVAMAVWALVNGDGGVAWGQWDGCRS
jgi:hypothetical protein